MTTSISPAPRHALLSLLPPLDDTPPAPPRHGIAVALELIAGGAWQWSCLYCDMTGISATDAVAIDAAETHVCAGVTA